MSGEDFGETVTRGVAKKRRLADLYVRGREIMIDDDSDDGDDPVFIWMHKISPLENKEAMDQANAMRARLMAARYAGDEDEMRLSLSSEAEMAGLFADSDTMSDYIHGADLARVRQSAEAEIGAEDEWSKNDYLDGMRKAWHGESETDGLKHKFAMDPHDAEAEPVFTELKRFLGLVEVRVEKERQRNRREDSNTDERTLRKKVIDLLIENEADQVWFAEFRKRQLFYGTREPEDHHIKYFSEVRELDMLDPKVIKQLMDAFDEVNVDPAEGKD